MALTTLRHILRGQSVLVVGSAPLTAAERDRIAARGADERLVAVNGGIGSTSGVPAVWVLNSRCYNAWPWTDPTIWPEPRKQLHQLMLAQGARRRVRHLLLLMKHDSTHQTKTRLVQQGTSWRGCTELWSGRKADLLLRAGIADYARAFNVSAGLSAMALSLWCGAAAVVVVGFAFTDGYAYCPEARGTRYHIQEDQYALRCLLRRYPHRLHLPPPIMSTVQEPEALVHTSVPEAAVGL